MIPVMINKAFSHRNSLMQTIKDPQSVHTLLEAGGLKAIVQKALQLNQISTLFDQMLPENLKNCCTVVNIKHLQLIVTVPSAAMLTECRFLEPDLLQQLKQHPALHMIRAIKFKRTTP
jgi:hypothetical protein